MPRIINNRVYRNETPRDPMRRRPVNPIFDARQNVIEACKDLLQAETHLFNPSRQCADCVQKHLLLAEGYADELASLDLAQAWGDEGRLIARTTRQAIAMLEAGAPPDDVGQFLRTSRKACMKATRDFTLERNAHARGFLRGLMTKKNLKYAAAAAVGIALLRRR